MRQISTHDTPELLRLNNRYAAELSLLDTAGFNALVGVAFYAKCSPDRSAFLIAIAHTATHDSPNFCWFKNTTDKFVYVDRVAVAASAQGAGLARRLYRDLFDAAVTAGFGCVCCEINMIPPNPASDRFHRAQGFAEVGRAELPAGNKTVRYLKKSLGAL
ncbi:MAG: GNAT family N-acetyltransferase [Hyphomicrobiales bacterium]